MCDKIRQLQAETRKEERARAAKREKKLKKEAEAAVREATVKAEQDVRNDCLKGMIEAHIPVESICAVLHMSTDAVRKQASLLGCVL